MRPRAGPCLFRPPLPAPPALSPPPSGDKGLVFYLGGPPSDAFVTVVAAALPPTAVNSQRGSPLPPVTALGGSWGEPRGSVCHRGGPAGRLLPGKTRGFLPGEGPTLGGCRRAGAPHPWVALRPPHWSRVPIPSPAHREAPVTAPPPGFSSESCR